MYAPLFWVLIVVLGGVFGSFLTCMLYRVPHQMPLSNPPSICPSCRTTLTALDLVPVFSFMFTGGKCRHCQTPVSPRYVWIELLTTATFAFIFYVVGLSFWLLPVLTLTVSLLFVMLLWVESKMLARKVLLFSITLFSVLFIYMR